jgi:selenium-dependent molybdenum hydroxylase system protein, yqeB family
MFEDKLIVVRGAGDIATGTINRLFKCGFNVLCLEVKNPSAIRRTVSYSECVYTGTTTIESTTSVLIESIEQMTEIHNKNMIPVIIDENCDVLQKINADVLIDAIIAKKNLGTKKDMADLTIALGPGFEAGVDVHYVIETMRGHSLGRVIEKGYAIKNTGVPGLIAGKSGERVIHAQNGGIIKNIKKISDIVKKDDIIATIDNVPVLASIDGLIRGLIRDSYLVHKGMKIADIDPRLDEYDNCFTISDKAKSIAGGVLEAIFSHWNKGGI